MQSHRGNLSGKASAIAKSIITGSWWRSDPITGEIPQWVERNNQFHFNQGPVDMEINYAKNTQSFLSLPPTGTRIGTYEARGLKGKPYENKETNKKGWIEVFLWHTFTQHPKDEVEFSVIPTKY